MVKGDRFQITEYKFFKVEALPYLQRGTSTARTILGGEAPSTSFKIEHQPPYCGQVSEP